VLRAVVLGAVVVATGCGGGDDGGPDAGEVLADRVVAVLEADGGAIDGDLTGAEVTCPIVRTPAEGDRATCVVRFDGSRVVEVDVEFQADGAIRVVAVVPR
jgi:hypothetical protein